MTLNETMARLCLAMFSAHLAADIKLYPLLLKFDPINGRVEDDNKLLREEIKRFVDTVLPAFLIRHRYADQSSTHPLIGMGWLQMSRSPLPQFSSNAEPTCAMIVGLTTRERQHESFLNLVNGNVGELARACSHIKNVRVGEALEITEVDAVIRDAFALTSSLDDFIMVEHHLWFDEWGEHSDPY